ncbi:ABC transporter permease [Devosia sp.]|uniref:ABC transporter permease n=1 Tax=Devosia sp. TaxID=1871048 RepID=UPI003A91FD44
MTDLAAQNPSLKRFRVDKLGVLIAVLVVVALVMPFAVFRANRIVPGEGHLIFTALPGAMAGLLLLAVGGAAVIALLRSPLLWRLGASFVALAALALAVGMAGGFLTPEGDKLARVSPGGGYWLGSFAFALLATDAFVRLKLQPWLRIVAVVVVFALIAALLLSGAWNDLSILKEYANRADTFWREAQTHVFLALGSLVAAALVGIPLGVLIQRVRPLRTPVLNVLNIIQTIPSIALFGLLIAPLAWVAANIPGAEAIGISGIGGAPALVALFGYSLLPMVANTVVGLEGVPPAAYDAARGMGMTNWQRLRQVEFPLAFPVILTGIRIVLVQNIGLATIAALIGGGGFGVFVFQGVGQTAMDLVLLGALPTVALAFTAAVVLDAVVEMVSVGGRK